MEMPMTTKDVPSSDKPAEPKPTLEEKAVAKEQAAVEKQDAKSADVLKAAAESGDAEVHNLLGQRAVAEQNADADALKEIDKQLAELVKV